MSASFCFFHCTTPFLSRILKCEFKALPGFPAIIALNIFLGDLISGQDFYHYLSAEDSHSCSPAQTVPDL